MDVSLLFAHSIHSNFHCWQSQPPKNSYSNQRQNGKKREKGRRKYDSNISHIQITMRTNHWIFITFHRILVIVLFYCAFGLYFIFFFSHPLPPPPATCDSFTISIATMLFDCFRMLYM